MSEQTTEIVKRPCDRWCDPQTGQHAPWCGSQESPTAGEPLPPGTATCEDYYCCNPFHEHDTFGWPACWDDEWPNNPPEQHGGDA